MIQPERRGGTVTYEAANAALGHERAAGQIFLAGDYSYFIDGVDDENHNQFGIDYMHFFDSSESDSLHETAAKLAGVEAHGAPDTPEHTKDMHKLEALDEAVAFLIAMNDVVASCIKTEGGATNDERCKMVASVFARYQERTGITGIQEWRDSLAHTVEFLSFYRKSVKEDILAHNWPEKLSAWRKQFVDFVKSPDCRKLFSSESVERSVLSVETVPILINDPISALIEKQQADKKDNTLGRFSGDERYLCIDPFTIQADLHYYRQSIAERLDMNVKATLFHELFHTITGIHYVAKATENRPDARPADSIDPHALWSLSWTEGMNEKFKGVAMSILATDTEWAVARKSQDPQGLDWLYEIDKGWRDSRAPRLPEMLSNEAVTAMNYATNAPYKEQRLMIDAFFAKLDWHAAGLTQDQAEALGAYAFGETPEDSSNYRLRFINAVNQAAYPGFFMKFQHAVDHHGESLITDVLLKDTFDPHDVHALPFTATARYRDFVRDTAASLASSQERLDRLVAAGDTPAWMIETTQKQVGDYQKMAGRLVLLSRAIQAERTILETIHPHGSKADAMLTVLYGESSAPHMAKILAGMLRGARQDIQRWRDEVART